MPNFARGTLVPVTMIFTELCPAHLSAPTTAGLLAILCFGVSYVSILTIEETFGKELDYQELKVIFNEDKDGNTPLLVDNESK